MSFIRMYSSVGLYSHSIFTQNSQLKLPKKDSLNHLIHQTFVCATSILDIATKESLKNTLYSVGLTRQQLLFKKGRILLEAACIPCFEKLNFS